MSQHVGPERHPHWLDVGLQLALGVLGIVCIVYPLVHRTAHSVAFLVTGMVLLGIVRLTDLVSRMAGTTKGRHHDRSDPGPGPE